MLDKIKKFGDFLYSQKIRLSTLFSLILHVVDIVTDILVTIDLYKIKSQYFPTSFGIIIFSFFGSALLSLDSPIFKELTSCERKVLKWKISNFLTYFLKIFLWITIDISQIIYVCSAFYIIFINKINQEQQHRLTDKRLKESLLESGPQSLFQLFLILKMSNNNTFFGLITYYLSIKFSLLSLTYTLVSIENNYPKYERVINGSKFINICKHNNFISNTSKYMINIIIFRFTEIFSRVGLLACVSQVFNGYILLLFILIDFILLNGFNLLKRFLRFKYERCLIPTTTIRTAYDQILNESEKNWKIRNELRTHYVMESAFKIQFFWRKKNNKGSLHILNRIKIYHNYHYKNCSNLKIDWNAYDSISEHYKYKNYKNVMSLLKNNKQRKVLNHYYNDTSILFKDDVSKKRKSLISLHHPFATPLTTKQINFNKYKSFFVIGQFDISDSERNDINNLHDKMPFDFMNQIIDFEEIKEKLSKGFGKEVISLYNVLNYIRYLGVYYKSFLQEIDNHKDIESFKYAYKKLGMKINIPSRKFWWNKISMHFLSRYLSHLFISILLIYKLIINQQSNTVIFISLSSIICYIINIFSFYIINIHNYETPNPIDNKYYKPLFKLKFNFCYKKKKDTENNNNRV
jgi:hypothetical protein